MNPFHAYTHTNTQKEKDVVESALHEVKHTYIHIVILVS